MPTPRPKGTGAGASDGVWLNETKAAYVLRKSRLVMDDPTQDPVLAIVRRALAEDVGDGDVTTQCTVPADSVYEGRIIAKAAGVVAGLDVAQCTLEVMESLHGARETDAPRVHVQAHVSDGARVEQGAVIATMQGPGTTLLSAERVMLNFLQRMSGIATLTARFVDAVRGTSAMILDTRKTAPGLRLLDKEAVRLGGGQNHRVGLYDMVLIKENHITAAGGIRAAVDGVRAGDPRGRAIEVEVQTLAELQEALALNVDRIMLDNMDLAQMREAVRLTDGAAPLEASGNVSLDTVAHIAATGVDYISVGQLTHSVTAFDMSFLLENPGK